MHRAPKPSGQREIKRKRIEQAHIVLGTNGLARTDDDRFAFLIVNTVLGGGMSSRLFQEIREKRGLAYTAYSFQSQYTEAGVFSAYAGTTPNRAAEVLGLMRRELDDVRDGGITPEEFARAKSHVKGSTVLSQEDPGSRMSRLGKSEVSHGEILTLSETLAARAGRDLGRCAPRGRAGTVPADDARGGGARRDEGAARGRAVIRVGVLGAAGRMGREICRAVAAADDLELVAAVDPNNAGLEAEGLLVSATVEHLADVDVAVDFTLPSTVMPNVRWCLRNGVHAVVGTTGLTPADLEELRAAADGGHGQLLRRAELRARRRAAAAVRGRGGPVLRRGRGDRAASRRRRPTRPAARRSRRPARSPPPARAIGPRPRRSGSTRERVAPRWTACGCTRCACRDWSPTKRCCSGVPDRRCRFDTTRWIGRRSCPGSCSRSAPWPIGPG